MLDDIFARGAGPEAGALPPGITSRWPAKMRLGFAIWFAATIELTLTPYRPAIPHRVDPRLTTCTRDARCCGGDAPCPADARGAWLEAGALPPGITSRWPAKMRLGFAIWFAATIELTLTPY